VSEKNTKQTNTLNYDFEGWKKSRIMESSPLAIPCGFKKYKIIGSWDRNVAGSTEQHLPIKARVWEKNAMSEEVQTDEQYTQNKWLKKGRGTARK